MNKWIGLVGMASTEHSFEVHGLDVEGGRHFVEGCAFLASFLASTMKRRLES